MDVEFKSNTVYFYSAYMNVIKGLVETGANGTKSSTSSCILSYKLVE